MLGTPSAASSMHFVPGIVSATPRRARVAQRLAHEGEAHVRALRGERAVFERPRVPQKRGSPPVAQGGRQLVVGRERRDAERDRQIGCEPPQPAPRSGRRTATMFCTSRRRAPGMISTPPSRPPATAVRSRSAPQPRRTRRRSRGCRRPRSRRDDAPTAELRGVGGVDGVDALEQRAVAAARKLVGRRAPPSRRCNRAACIRSPPR